MTLFEKAKNSVDRLHVLNALEWMSAKDEFTAFVFLGFLKDFEVSYEERSTIRSLGGTKYKDMPPEVLEWLQDWIVIALSNNGIEVEDRHTEFLFKRDKTELGFFKSLWKAITK
jgi:hypothetical protein